MVAVGRSWVMETQGTYQAGNTADDNATPEKVVPLRPYTKVYNDYYDPLWPIIGPFRYFVLQYLIRQTWGFHRDAARLPLGTISTTLQLSRHVVINALRDLEAWHIIASDASDRGRTQVRTYRMLPPEQWTLPAQTSASDALVEKKERTSARHAPVMPQTSANNALDDSQTSASHAPIKRKPESKEKREKENNSSDADAPTPRKRTSSRPRKLSDEQYAAKMQEEEWMAAIFAGMEDINGYPVTGKGKERAAAHDLYRYRGPKNRDEPLTPERILDCYRLTLIDPFYSTQQLSLHTILKVIGAYLIKPENYRTGMEEKRRKAEYARNAGNGAQHPHANGRKPTGKSGDWGDHYAMNADELKQSFQDDLEKMGYPTGKGKDA